MRFTIRLISKMMNALECSLDELAMETRGNAKYGPKVQHVRKLQMAARSAANELLDTMIDDGFGS